MIIVNPRSGARKGEKLLKKYGTFQIKMNFGEIASNVQLFDVTT